jgi:tRNA pseudouridine38-40 synthase
MYYYKLTIAYDGTDYEGWQVQPHGRAIANVIEATFKTVFDESIRIIGASRTDAGVHAYGQIASLATQRNYSPSNIQFALNNKLPAAIRIRECVALPTLFNPLAHVERKEYWYHFFLESPSLWAYRYGWYIKKQLDMQRLEQVLQLFVGTHDFKAFCVTEGEEPTVRTIESIEIEWAAELHAYRIIVKGPGFLRYMIRRIIGAALYVASHPPVSTAILAQALRDKKPVHYLPTAPAQGLVLYAITYKQ